MGKTEQRIAEFIVETSVDDIPEGAYAAANMGIFDCVGVILAAVDQAHGRMIIDYATREGEGNATILGAGRTSSQSMAALANGTLGHALDFDDGGGGGGFGHPTVVLFPAGLAVGEQQGISGRELLAAYVIGFEVGSRIAQASRYQKNESGFHNTSMYGALTSAAVAARLLGLNQEQTVMALGAAGSMANGVLQNFGTHTKPLHAGMASHAGVMSAQLAKDGWLASDHILESRIGWSAAFIGNGNFDAEKMADGLGTRWVVDNAISIKKYPACFSTHSTIDSILDLKREHPFTLDEVDEVVVTQFPAFSHILFYPDPDYGFQGKFSVHHCAAVALVDGHIDHDSFTDEQIHRPEYREALAKLDIQVMSEWDPKWRHAPQENPVTIRLKDGRVLTRSTNRRSMLGSVNNPLSDDQLTEKFRKNALLVLPPSQVEDAIQQWKHLDRVDDIRQAVALVAGSTVPA